MSMPMQRRREQQEQKKSPLAVTVKHHMHNWDEFLSDAKKSGLQIGMYEDYEGKGLKKEGKNIQAEVILFDKERGIIVYAYTFSGKSVNYAKLYAELKRKELPLSDAQKKILTSFNHWQLTKEVVAFAMDVRYGVRLHIQNIAKQFDFHSPWSITQEFQFVNIAEKDGISLQDRNTITQRKLTKCDPIVREIIGM